MRLITLGSGTCVPSLERSSPANFIQIGRWKILVDIGSSALHQLQKASLSYKDIDMVFITHFHHDHVAGLGPFLQAQNWTPGFDRKKKLVLLGPPGLREHYEQFLRHRGARQRPGTYRLIIREIKRQAVFSGFKVYSHNVIHRPESIAYKFVAGKKSLVISGDTDYDPGLARFARGADLLLLECSFPDGHKVKGHLTPSECGSIAKAAKAKRLVLTHLYPPFSDSQRLRQAKRVFPVTYLAQDLKGFPV
ncbi:MAG: MBL fold metallo-hydrolase [Nanoarchaeota archaeon]